MLLTHLHSKLFNLKVAFTRKYSSALYITGDKAQTIFSILTPHIDVVERFEDREGLEKNIKARGKCVDLDAIVNRWAFYQNLLEKRCILKETKQEIANELSRLLKDDGNVKYEQEIAKLQTHAKIVSDEYLTLRDFLYGVEESAALKALSLPNVLHPQTPLNNANVLLEYLEKPVRNEKCPSHVEIGKDNELIEMYEEQLAFLINDAAWFEQAVLNCFHDKLTQRKLIPFSNADFVKSVIVEGCGSDFRDKNEVITLENDANQALSRLHLTGGASHFAFMAHFTKCSIFNSQMPLNYFAIGRKYQPTFETTQPSLFNLAQQSAVEVFSATRNTEEMDKSLEELVETIGGIYKLLGVHFRLVLVPAKNLRDYESLRVAIEMYSNYSESYVEIGSLSVLDDYISKRLLITYNANKQRKFIKLITGNVVNVQKILGCVLENNWTNGRLNSILSDTLKTYVPCT